MGLAETMAQFVARRRRDRTLARGAEALTYKVYKAAIRAGEDLSLPTTRDVIDYGVALKKKKPGAPAPQLKRSITVEKVAGDVAEDLGRVAGVGRGAVHSAEGLVDGGVFLGRLSLLDERAWTQVDDATRATANYAARVISDPSKVIRDIDKKKQQMRIDLDPGATPEAATPEGELRRRFGYGMNQGELMFDVGTVAVGGPLAKSFKTLGRASKAIPDEEYIARGYTPESIAYLNELYPSSGKGSHFFPRRFGLPKIFSDSDYNVLRPHDATRREMYEEHARIDDRFKGAKLPAEFGQHWSAKRLGIERYGPAGVIWYGSPPPLKARVGGFGAAAGGLSHDLSAEDETW